MATNYPGAIDALTNPGAGDALTSPSHSAQHANANDAIEAIETELGTNPSGSESTVAARLTAIEAGTRMGTGSIGATALADNAVDTAAIADGAVTSAKIADGTITSTDVAASTFAAFGTVGNLLTANQASATGGGWYGTANSTYDTTTDGGVTVGRLSLTGATAEGNLATSNPIPAGDLATVTLSVKASRTQTGRLLVYGLTDTSWNGVLLAGRSPLLTITAGQWVDLPVTFAVQSGKTHIGLIFTTEGSSQNGDTILLTRASLHRGAGGTFSMPGTPVVGQSHIATNGAVHLSGTGTPEGVITAAPGSTWLQTDSTTDVKGWLKWVKATGTGNTGWVAGAEADTGLRNVSAALVAGANVSLSYTFLQRTGNRVDVSFRAMYSGGAVGANAVTLFELPTGFRPVAVGIRDFVIADGGATPVSIRQGFLRSHVFQVYNPTPSTEYNGMFTIATPDAWPSSLPGSAA